MVEFSLLGKWLLGLGLGLAVTGGLIWMAGRLPFLSRLPGDINIEGQHFKFYFPVSTCLLVSAIVSLILSLFSKYK